VLVSPAQWADILATCAKRADGPDDLLVMVKASADLALRRAGIDELDAGDPRTPRMADDIVRSALEFLQQADIPLGDKWHLAIADADVPDDMLLEAKQQACKTMEAKAGLFSGQVEASGFSAEDIREIRSRWRGITPERA
jgi:hypothetical protein